MQTPLAELDAWWDAAAPDDGGAWTGLTALQAIAEGFRIDFQTVDDANAQAAWRLDIEETLEMAWRDDGGEPVWSDDHILLAPYDAKGALISFSKPLKDPLRAWGAAAKAHGTLVGDWFSLGRFLTGSFDWAFGQLASGPERLLAVYADALRSVGEDLVAVPHDQSWRAKDPSPSIVVWGKSYFVARSFRLERLA